MSRPSVEQAWRRLAQNGPGTLVGYLALAVLVPASWLYRLASAMKRTWFWKLPGTQTRVPAQVISVGNLTVGGSGKTPLAALVAGYAARELELGTAILTRGYRAVHRRLVTKAAAHGQLLVPPEEVGDEGILLASKCPEASIWVARRRALAARAACEQDDVDALVLDDGLQYWRLARDGDIVSVDATCPFGSGRFFPAGLLREPPGALRRATAIVLRQPSSSASIDPPEVRTAAPDVPRYLGRYRYTHWRTPAGEQIELADGAARIRSACAAIARPELFFAAVQEMAGRDLPCYPRGDHEPHRAGDLAQLPKPIAMTEKDGPNLPEEYAKGDEVLLLAADYEVVPLEDAPPFRELLRGCLLVSRGADA